jgi:uncharacterized protein DUF6265
MTRIIVLNLVRWMVVAWVILAAKPLDVFAQQTPSNQAPRSGNTPAAQPALAGKAQSGTGNALENSENALKASLADFAWLEGKWQGNWGPRLAEEVWIGPRAGEMAGLFRVAENDKTLVLELYSLVATPDGIELRLRHFTPSLVAWEPSVTVLQLASVSAIEAVFRNAGPGQPSVNTLIRIDPDTYVSRTEITSGSDNRQVTEIRFQRVKSAPEEAPSQKKKKR